MFSAAEIQQKIEQSYLSYKQTDLSLRDKLVEKYTQLKAALRDNLKTLKDPILTEADIVQQTDKIMIILGHTDDDFKYDDSEKVLDYCRKLDALELMHDKELPGILSKIEGIEDRINAYLVVKRDIIANHIAFQNAKRQGERINTFIATLSPRYPDAGLAMLVLKRHEVCSNLGKGFGFKADAGLDAFNLTASQSEFALSVSKSVQNKQLVWMKEMGLINRVEMIVSPVARAYQTALHATFEPAAVDKVFIDNHFAEKQMDTTVVASGRASRVASRVAREFKDAGYEPVIPKEDFIIPGETELEFIKRRNVAYQRMLTAPLPNDGVMRIIVGHGKMNKTLLSLLKGPMHKIKSLNFGGQYNLLIARDNNHHIIAIEDEGNLNRYGQVEPTSFKTLAIYDTEYMETLDEAIKKEKSLAHKAELLFLRCMHTPTPNIEEVCHLIENQDNCNLMLDNLPFFGFENLERAEFILDTLLATQYKHLADRIEQESTSTLAGVTHHLTNFFSGKYPNPQKNLLVELHSISKNPDNPAKLEALRNLVQAFEKHCKEGKVTNLCRAKYALCKTKLELASADTNPGVTPSF